MRLVLAAVLLLAPTLAHAAKPEKDDVEHAGDPQSKMICKRFADIGSLVANHKECRTKAEWDYDREQRRSLPQSGRCAGGQPGGSCG